MIRNDKNGTKIYGDVGTVLNNFTNIANSLDKYLVTKLGVDRSVVPKILALCLKMVYADDDKEVEELVSGIQDCLNGGDSDVRK